MRAVLKSISLILPLAALFLEIVAASAVACPDINGVVDTDCNRRLIVAAWGDSITAGKNDILKDPQGRTYGYPTRMKLTYFPAMEIINLGKAGESSGNGVIRASQTFPNLSGIDYVIVLEGVNDYYEPHHFSPTTKSNLQSIFRSGRDTGALGLLSNLTDVNRNYQRPWVLATNDQVNPIRQVDLFKLGIGILGSDGLHPTSTGYQKIAQSMAGQLMTFSEAHRPVDSDNDGLYDFEEARFGTNVFNADSDGDGIKDGVEVYTYGSNPKSLDSDNDGISDHNEVFTLHSDPADAKPGLPVLTALQAIP